MINNKLLHAITFLALTLIANVLHKILHSSHIKRTFGVLYITVSNSGAEPPNTVVFDCIVSIHPNIDSTSMNKQQM